MRRDRKAPEIKWSIFATFIVFTASILIALWLLQSLLLDTFYFFSSKNRMKEIAFDLSHASSQTDFEKQMTDLATEEEIAILCCFVDDSFSVYAETEDDMKNIVLSLDRDTIATIYERTKQNEGFIQERFDVVLAHSQRRPVRQANSRLLTATVISQGKSEALLLLDSSIEPSTDITQALQQQFVFTSVLLLGFAAAVSFFIARHISQPLVRISQKAKRISQGKYNTDFSETSYREIEELSETLNQASDELSKIDRLQKELIANISHDLRTPLTMIVGYAQVMRDIEGENTPENVQVIIDEAERLTGLVNDLLEISRIQGGISPRRDELFAMEALVEDTVARYRRLKENGGFSFAYRFEGKTAPVYADKGKMLQALCNLLNNAINYSADDKRIEVCVSEKEGRVRVEVRDFGIGISEEDLPNVWQRYYKVDKTHRRSSVGSGLGLSIVREILEMHDARYGVQSKLGEGSVFWFELPIQKEAALLPTTRPSLPLNN